MAQASKHERRVTSRIEKQHGDACYSASSSSSRLKLQSTRASDGSRLRNLDEEKKKMEDTKLHLTVLANMIIPPSWNVYLNPDEREFKPGTLNIEFRILDDSDWDWAECAALKAGLQTYSRISSWAPFSDEALMTLCNNRDGTIGDTGIWFKASLSGVDVLLHELAHVVADRLYTWNQRTHRIGKGSNLSVTPPPEEDAHGPLFQRAYRIIIKRAERCLPADTVERHRKELEAYEERFRLYGRCDHITDREKRLAQEIVERFGKGRPDDKEKWFEWGKDKGSGWGKIARHDELQRIIHSKHDEIQAPMETLIGPEYEDWFKNELRTPYLLSKYMDTDTIFRAGFVEGVKDFCNNAKAARALGGRRRRRRP